MVLRKELALVIIVLFVQRSLSQYPKVLCPSVFRYEQLLKQREVIGRVFVDGVKFGRTWLKITLSQPEPDDPNFDKTVDFPGNITLDVDENDIYKYIESGKTIAYKVLFPLSYVIPIIHSIQVNVDTICTGPTVPPGNQKFVLRHIMNIPEKISPTTEILNSDNTAPVASSTTRTLLNANSIPSTTSTPDDDDEYDDGPDNNGLTYIDSVCGRENHDNPIVRLIHEGVKISESRFPWIVALYRKSTPGKPAFKCGGSLITQRTVISAAHCIYSGPYKVKEEDILVSLGRHNLTDWTAPTIIQSDVDKIVPHPDYNHQVLHSDADIAIIQLKKSVKFSDSIKPICMWQGGSDISEIINISGTVVGWGQDESNIGTSNVPKSATAKIVSRITCLESNPSLVPLTSNRTLCAGNLDNSGPCSGDSGSGLMIEIGNKWRLRGIVSVALRSNFGVCNLTNYVVYSDIAQFTGWIYDNTVF